MATIQIKRNNSNAATKPSSLLVGELAGNLLDRSLFSSDGSNVFQFYTGTTKWFDTSGNANNANKLGGVAASSYQTIINTNNKIPFDYISGKPTTLGGYGITDAISTSGGTITGLTTIKRDAVTPFEIENTAGTNSLSQVVLRYRYNGSYISGIGAKTDGYLYRYDSTLSNAYKIWDTGNFNPANYLPLSGGTIKGSITAKRYYFGDKNDNGYGYLTVDDSVNSRVYYVDNLGAYNIIIHSGNYSSYALPLTGGTLTGVLTIHADNVSGQQQGLVLSDPGYGGNEALKIVWKSSTYADGVYLVGRPDINVLDFNGNTVIHSGNIGSQSVDRAIALRGIYPSVTSTNDFYNTEQLIKYHAGFSPDFGNVPSSNSWQNGLLEIGLHSDGASAQFFFSAYKRLYYRSHQTDAWHGVAYLTDNVASATKLQTARTIWGQSFDGTADVSGVLTLPANHQLQWVNSNSMIYGNGSNITISNTGNLTIATSGNVLIGTTTDNGYKLYVNGTSYFGSSLSVNGDITATAKGTFSDIEAKSISKHDSGTGYYVGGRNYGLGATDGGALVYAYGATPISFYTNATERMSILGNGNVLIGNTTDRGHKLAVIRENSTMTASTLHNSALFIGSSNSVDSYGLNLWTEGSGNGFIQQGRTDEEQPKLYNLSLQPFGGNVLIGTTTDSGDKLRINGAVRTAGHIRLDRYHGASEYLQLEAEDVNINYRAYDTDGWCSHNFYSNDNLLVKIDGYAGKLDVNGNLVATGDGVFGSDARYKSKLQDLAVDIETIANAPVFSYKWTDREDDKVHLGTTAQYWLPTKFCDAVDTSNPNFYHLNYGGLGVAIGVTVAKEQIIIKKEQIIIKSEVEVLRERVKELENQVKQLRQWHN